MNHLVLDKPEDRLRRDQVQDALYAALRAYAEGELHTAREKAYEAQVLMNTDVHMLEIRDAQQNGS